MLTASEILVIIIIIVIVLWSRNSSYNFLEKDFTNIPKIKEMLEIVAKTHYAEVYTDHYRAGNLEVYFSQNGHPNIDLETAKKLAKYLSTAMPRGTRCALVKIRADSNWRPSSAPDSIASVVINSHSANVYSGGYSDAPSRGRQIGWYISAAKKKIQDATGDTEYIRS